MAVDVGEAGDSPAGEGVVSGPGRDAFGDGLDPPRVDLNEDVLRGIAQPSLLGVPQPGSLQLPVIGMWTPRSRATSMARSEPASAWRIPPVPGSLVRTRSSLRAASSDPSATTTIPAWID